jgi:hypothetical protein
MWQLATRSMRQRQSCLERLLTHPVRGLDNYKELIEKLNNGKSAMKAFCDVAPQ